jgi:hypothetical protein
MTNDDEERVALIATLSQLTRFNGVVLDVTERLLVYLETDQRPPADELARLRTSLADWCDRNDTLGRTVSGLLRTPPGQVQ